MSTTIPILPCGNVDDIVAFYESLGFSKTYRQLRPNPYVVVKLDDIEFHFFGLDNFDPEKSIGTCAVRADGVDSLYRSFVGGLRATRGKVPWAGIPRLTRPRKKMDIVHGFSVIDPGGNWIRITETKTARAKETPAKSSKLAQALDAAARLGDSHGDQKAAARLLDRMIARMDGEPIRERVPVLVYRAELAIAMKDPATATKWLAELRKLPLSPADRDALAAELDRASEIEEDTGR